MSEAFSGSAGFQYDSAARPDGKNRVFLLCHPADDAFYAPTLSRFLIKARSGMILVRLANSTDPEQAQPTSEGIRREISGVRCIFLAVTSRLVYGGNDLINSVIASAKTLFVPMIPLFLEPGLTDAYKEKFGHPATSLSMGAAVGSVPGERESEKLSALLNSLCLSRSELVRMSAGKALHSESTEGRYAQALAILIGDASQPRSSAVDALSQAADAGSPEAAGRLARLYRFGDGVAANLEEALSWQTRACSLCVKRAEKDLTNDNMRLFLEALKGLEALQEEMGDAQGAWQTAGQMLLLARKLAEGGRADARREEQNCLSLLGDIALVRGDLKSAGEYYSKVVSMLEALARASGLAADDMTLRKYLFRLGKKYAAVRKNAQAKDYLEHVFDDRLCMGAPEDADLLLRAETSLKLAELCRMEGNTSDAEEACGRAMTFLEAIPRESYTISAIHTLATAHNSLGELLLARDLSGDGRGHLLKALFSRESLVKKDASPWRILYRREIADSYRHLGELFSEKGQTTAAKDYLRKAVAHLSAACKDTDAIFLRRLLATEEIPLGEVFLSLKDTAHGEECLSSRLKLSERLTDQTGAPEDRLLLIEAGRAYMAFLIEQDRKEEALAIPGRVLPRVSGEALRPTAEILPLVSLYEMTANLREEKALASDARSALKTACTLLADASLPADVTPRRAENLEKLADLSLTPEWKPEAVAALKEAIPLREKLAADMRSVEMVRLVAKDRTLLARLLAEGGDEVAAETEYVKALDLRRTLHSELPSLQAARDLAESLGALGFLSEKQGNMSLSNEYFREAAPLWERAADEDPAARLRLVPILRRLGDGARATDPRGAEQYYRRALTLWESAETITPEGKIEAAVLYESLSDLTLAQSRYPEAIAELKQALAFRSPEGDPTEEERKALAECYRKFTAAYHAAGEAIAEAESRRHALSLYPAESAPLERAALLERLADIYEKEEKLAYMEEALEIWNNATYGMPSSSPAARAAAACAAKVEELRRPEKKSIFNRFFRK